MTEPIIISTAIIGALSVLGGILLKLHLKKCKCGKNMECKCDGEQSSPNSPISLTNKIKKFFSSSNIKLSENNNNDINKNIII